MRRVTTWILTMVLIFACMQSVSAEVYGTDFSWNGHAYRLVVSDCTWMQAFQSAKDAGGHLATLESADEFNTVVNQITQAGLSNIMFRIGGRRDLNSSLYYWTDADNNLRGDILNSPSSWAWTFWMIGEPSLVDGAVQENVMDLYFYKGEGRWVLNDVPDDIISVVPSYSGMLGYIIEFDNSSPVVPPSTILSMVPDEFYFSSGVGAWSTMMTLQDDGTFSGTYGDSNMGEDTEHYPGGVHYYCNFTGSFTEFRKVDPYTWSMRLASLNYEDPVGFGWTDGSIHYIASDAYGISGGDLFYLYLPGHPVSTLSEGFMSWARMYMGYQDLTTLNIYGIYNVNGEDGWGGRP